MKKLSVFAIATLAAVGLSSCLKEKIHIENGTAEGTHTLTLRLANNSTRAVEDPAALTADQDIVLSDGVIFVFGGNGNLILKNNLEPAAAISPAGQTLTTPIKKEAGASVFVIGNLGNLSSPAFQTSSFLTEAEVVAAGSGTAAKIADLLAVAENLTTLTGAKFGSAANFIKNVPLATAKTGTFGAQAITFVDVDKTANVSTPLVPLVSRIEFAQVGDYADDNASPMAYTKGVAQGTTAGTGKGYKVAGVFLTGYAPQYTWAGTYAGTVVDQTDASYKKATGTGLMNASEYAATGNIGEVLAVPLVADGTGKAKNTNSKVFAYNIPAGLAPKIMVRIDAANATDFNEDGYQTALTTGGTDSTTAAAKADTNNDGTVDAVDAMIKTVTVKSYTGVTEFLPGKIYKVAEIPFDSNSFYELSGDYQLTVNVSVVDWEEVTLTPEM